MRTLLLLFPATAIAVAGYVVLYISAKTEGGLRRFGKFLGGWVMFLSALVVAAAISGVFMDGRPFGLGMSRAERMEMRQQMRDNLLGPRRMGPPPGMPAPPSGEAPPAPPATPPANN